MDIFQFLSQLDYFTIITQILSVVICVVAFVIAFHIHGILFAILNMVDIICNAILTPMKAISEFFSNRIHMPTIIHCILVLLITLATCVFLYHSFGQVSGTDELMELIASNTPLYSLVHMTPEDFSPENYFNFATLGSVCLSSFISFVYTSYMLDTFEKFAGKGWFRNVIVFIPNALFYCVSVLLAPKVSVYFHEIGVSILDTLFNPFGQYYGSSWVVLDFLYTAYNWIASIFFLYIIVLICSIIVQEIITNLCYGLLGMIALFAVALVQSYFQLDVTLCYGITIAILLVIEYIRANPDLQQSYKKFLSLE